MIKSLLKQFKKRRLALGLRQKDMLLRVGVSRQQYQQIESKGNPRLETLELIAQGLQSELMLIPLDKLDLIKQILKNETLKYPNQQNNAVNKIEKNNIESNPWDDLLEGIE